MSFPKIIIFCLACALAGAGAGFGAGIFSARFAPRAPAKSAQQRQPQTAGDNADDDERDSARKWEIEMNKEHPDIANFTTPAEWRAYLEKWVAADYPNGNSGAARECFERWSKNDPDGALEFIRGAPDFPDRNMACAKPLAQIGRTAASRIVEWLWENLAKADRDKVADEVIFDLCYRKPYAGRQAAELALAGGISARPVSFGYVMEALARSNVADALEVFAKVPDSARDDAARYLISAWKKKDFDAAVDWCATQHGTPHEKTIMREMLDDCARDRPAEMPALVARLGVDLGDSNYSYAIDRVFSDDPLAAFELLKMMPPEKRGNHAWELVGALLKTDPDQAVAVAQLLLPADRQADVLYRNWLDWARSDRQSAEAWLDALPDAVLRAQLKTMNMSETEPLAFLSLVDSSAAGTFSDRQIATALYSLGSDYAHSGLDAAKRWLLAHPEQINKDTLACGIKASTPDFTLAEIGTLPEGQARDLVLASMEDRWLWARDWEQLSEAIPLYENAAKQDALRFQVFAKMYLDGGKESGKDVGKDGTQNGGKGSAREAASQWLATQPLPDEVRESWEALAKAGLLAPRTRAPSRGFSVSAGNAMLSFREEGPVW